MKNLQLIRHARIAVDYGLVFVAIADVEGVLARDWRIRRGIAGKGHARFGISVQQIGAANKSFESQFKEKFRRSCTDFEMLIVSYFSVFVAQGPVVISSLPDVVARMLDCVALRNWMAHGRFPGSPRLFTGRPFGSAAEVVDTVEEYWNSFFEFGYPFLGEAEDDLVESVSSQLF